MRALRLDYREHRGLWNFFGYLLLALVLALALSTGGYFFQLRQQRAHYEDLIERLDGNVKVKVNVGGEARHLDPAKLPEVIKFSNKVIHQLNLPWEMLFTQLEDAKTEDVALLGIEPNVKGTSIKVEAEAKDYAAMLKYVRSLSKQGVLQDVYLTEHKMDDQNPDKPVRFSLEASWVAK